MSRNQRRFDQLFSELVAAEDSFLQSEFLAPVLRNGRVSVRIAGVVCQMEIAPRNFSGWGLFQPCSQSRAKLVREATLKERQQYLELMPALSLILTHDQNGNWQGMMANRGDSRFQLDGTVPVQLIDDAACFEIVRVRFDGVRFWYEGRDTQADLAAARYLREMLQEGTPVEELSRKSLTLEQRVAYLFVQTPHPEAKETQLVSNLSENRIEAALGKAGAELLDYAQRGDSYRITWSVKGRRYVSSVNRDDLSVQVAGICLSGQDPRFDLTSLVGVMSEAGGNVLHIGNQEGLSEEDYWDIHPPEPDEYTNNN